MYNVKMQYIFKVYYIDKNIENTFDRNLSQMFLKEDATQ